MTNKYIFFILLATLYTLSACKKEEDQQIKVDIVLPHHPSNPTTQEEEKSKNSSIITTQVLDYRDSTTDHSNLPDCESDTTYVPPNFKVPATLRTDPKFTLKNEIDLYDDAKIAAYKKYIKKIKRKKCRKDWTVLVFMAADNNLSPYGFWDIYEMERKIESEFNKGTTTKRIDVIVEFDRFDDYTNKALYTGIRRYHVFQSPSKYNPDVDKKYFKTRTARDIYSPITTLGGVTGKYKELKTASRRQKNRFKRFIDWGVKYLPSKQYMVVIWGHGEGYVNNHEYPQREKFRPPSNEDTSDYLSLAVLQTYKIPNIFPTKRGKKFGGVALDLSDLTYLDIPEISSVLKEVSSKYLNRPIDILTFDACLMQSIEIASELQNDATYLIASTQLQNYLGLPYRKIFDEMNSQRLSAYQLQNRIVTLAAESNMDGSYQHHANQSAQNSFTLNSINLAEFKNILQPQIQSFAKHLLKYLNEKPYRLSEIKYIINNSPTFLGGTKDFGLFLGHIIYLLDEEKKNKSETVIARKLRIEINDTLDVIHQVIMNKAYGSMYIDHSNYYLGFFKALSIWLPPHNDDFENRIEEFQKSAFYKSIPAWAELVNKIYQ